MDAQDWHDRERAAYALALAELAEESPVLAEAAAAGGPAKMFRCPKGHRLLALSPALDGYGRVVLTSRGWVDPKVVQPAYPGSTPRRAGGPMPAALDAKVALTCAACAYRREFYRGDLLRHYAVALYRRGDIILPP